MWSCRWGRLALVLLAAGCVARPLDLPATTIPDLGADSSRPSDLRTTPVDAAFTADLATSVDFSSNFDFDFPADGASADLSLSFDLATAPIDLSPSMCGDMLCAIDQPCTSDADCLSAACDSVSHQCVADPCADHHQDGRETDSDCGDGICALCATGKRCTSPTQCQSSGCDAITHQCAVSSCVDGQRDGFETDVDCGGGTCRACFDRQKCGSNFDCASGYRCLSGTCSSTSCFDTTRDFSESDIDCGGSCGGCALGKSCSIDYDCASNACGASKVCVASLCSDGVFNGDETNTDCGGACTGCALGLRCTIDHDCASDACDAITTVCVASECADRRQDGSETDVDCGGSCAPCALYLACSGSSDCASNACDLVTHVCVAPTCIDGILDGNETAIDCGGTCARCALGVACRVDQDCASKACDGIAQVCVADQCANHRREIYETDTDCGGAYCPTCTLGKKCTWDPDCASNACDATHHCQVERCSDGVIDGSESDLDCGGGGYGGSPACDRCALGQHCNYATDCASLACHATTRMCVADHCSDQTIDGDETDLDCGGATCATRCGLSEFCNHDADCIAGLHCSGSPQACY